MNRPPRPGKPLAAPDLQAIFNRAVEAHRAGHLDVAAELYRQILSYSKKQFEPLHLLGVIEAQRGNMSEGIRQVSKAIKLNPHSADAYLNLGRMQGELGDLADAEKNLRRSIALNAKNPVAYGNLAAVLRRLHRYDDALACADHALALAPGNSLALFNRANILFDLKRYDESRAIYEQTLSADPNDAKAWLGLGNVCKALKHHEDALKAFDRAIQLDPSLTEAWFGRGITLLDTKKYDQAIEPLKTAFQRNPALRFVKGLIAHSRSHICEWPGLKELQDSCIADIRAGLPSIQPFPLLVLPTLAKDQLQCARIFDGESRLSAIKPLWRGERYRHDRIRLAYLSGDFREHAVPYLAAGLFEHHDRAAFETIAISVGPDDKSAMRSRLAAAFDRFIDAQSMADDEIARLIRDLEVDVLVDLTGHTSGSRLGTLAFRPAPVQATYLGYPGTTGTDFIDYIIADPTVIPADQQQFYTEKVAYLPDCYLPNDRTRAIGAAPNRAAAGLPDTGFVFCSFNNAYKITPIIFDVWMRLLKAVPGSILWLPTFSEIACANLRKEAEARGVDSARIVFAPRVERQEDHLARVGLADLFLDTPNYNAHSTACDALWAGVPLVTCIGKAFAGRVGASALKAVGLPELVTTSLEDYEALALKLAGDPALLAATRAKLAAQRLTAPLFDTERFTRNLEALYRKMWERAQAGEPPGPLSV